MTTMENAFQPIACDDITVLSLCYSLVSWRAIYDNQTKFVLLKTLAALNR